MKRFACFALLILASLALAPAAPAFAQKTVTADPVKLAAVDELLDLLENDVAAAIVSGVKMTEGPYASWRVAMRTGGDWQAFRDEMTKWRDTYAPLSARLAKLTRDNKRFPDLASFAYPKADELNAAMTRFIDTMLKFSAAPPAEVYDLIDPPAQAFTRELTALEAWRSSTIEKAAGARKALAH